jgi:hypothetical protein
MIYCIISTGGYVETAQIASITWVTNYDDVTPAEAETPEQAVKSLANDLLLEYLNSWLGTTRTGLFPREASIGATYSDQYFAEEFESWVYDLVQLDSCNDGFHHQILPDGRPGPEHWSTYLPLSVLRSDDLKDDEILIIPENFEKIIAYNIDPDLLPDDEARKNHQEYMEDNYPTEYRVNEDGFHEASLNYDANVSTIS